jgi:hypothetical protein
VAARSRSPILVDDRLLIEELLVGLPKLGRVRPLFCTLYWYYRACRAAVAGAGGHLSGPFEAVGSAHQQQAILSLLELRDDIGLPEARATVPVMAELSIRHPRLNVLNLEVCAAARNLSAEVWLSEPSSDGVLPGVLDAEGLRWRTVALPE